MSGPNGIERRDPCKPILTLGTALGQVRRCEANGFISLRAGIQIQNIQIINGKVSDLSGANGCITTERAEQLFSLPRPLVKWHDHSERPPLRPTKKGIDPAHLLVKGVIFRQDVFDPVSFVERVPVETLKIESSQIWELQKYPFSSQEIEFFKQLSLPTPIPMILWKRGVAPGHAASLLTALNLLGLWSRDWRPGHLPTIQTVHRIIKRASHHGDDFQLLELQANASSAEVDRAFRRLSFELHPDRNRHRSETEQEQYRQAFEIISNAYQRLRRVSQSRRKSRVTTSDTSLWQRALTAAETAFSQGNIRLAKKHAINGLSLHPPPFARTRFTTLLKMAAA